MMKNFKKYHKIPYNKTSYYKVQKRNEHYAELREAVIRMIEKERLEDEINSRRD